MFFSVSANSVNTLRASPLYSIEYVRFVLVQGSFTVSRQIAGVVWEGDTGCWRDLEGCASCRS